MRHRPEVRRLFSRPVGPAGLAACAVMLGVGGCANMQEGVGPPTSVPTISNSAPQNTGTYPNLNIRPATAAPQLTTDQRAAAASTLAADARAAQTGVATTTLTPEEQARLRKLAADRGEEVLAEIEGRK